jgi:hypothetical protein
MIPEILLLTLAVAAPPAPVAGPAVPPEIRAYYADYNFVNGSSTPAERRSLASSRTAPADTRLLSVAKALERMARRTDDADAGIAPGAARHESEFRTSFARVVESRVDEEKGAAWLRVEVFTTEESDPILRVQKPLVTLPGGRPAPPEIEAYVRDVMRQPRPPNVSTEVHLWVQVDGEWRRQAIALHF